MIAMLMRRLRLLAVMVIVLVGVFIADTLFSFELRQFGIWPRQVDSWFHLALAPFIHGDWSHLLNNLIGLMVMSLISLRHSVRQYLLASIFIILVSGVLVWLFARPAIHLGASGWIFGLWAWQISLALFARSFANVLVALLVVFAYGGLAFGLLPVQPGVSFESHIAGAVAGVAFAFLSASSSRSQSESETNLK